MPASVEEKHPPGQILSSMRRDLFRVRDGTARRCHFQNRVWDTPGALACLEGSSESRCPAYADRRRRCEPFSLCDEDDCGTRSGEILMSFRRRRTVPGSDVVRRIERCIDPSTPRALAGGACRGEIE